MGGSAGAAAPPTTVPRESGRHPGVLSAGARRRGGKGLVRRVRPRDLVVSNPLPAVAAQLGGLAWLPDPAAAGDPSARAPAIRPMRGTGRCSGFATALNVGAALSTFACALASADGAARVIFSLSRDKRLPDRLAAVHPKHHSPHIALGVATAVGMAISLAFAAVPTTSLLYFLNCGRDCPFCPS